MAMAVVANATHGKIATHQRQLAERLAVLAAEGPARGPLVVTLGNSLVHEGLVGDSRLEALLRARHGDRPVRHWNTSSRGMVLADFEPYWDHLTRLRPAIVIIQREFVAADQAPDQRGRALGQFRRFLIATLLPPGSPLAPEQPGVWNEEQVNDRVADMLANAQFNQPVPGTTMARLRALLDGGTRVAVLTVPRAARLEALGADVRVAWARKLAQREALGGRLEFLTFDGTLADHQFQDGTHLNQRGQTQFSAWYAGAVARLVSAGPASLSAAGTRPGRPPRASAR
jgi:hypothetical protein